MDIFPHSSHSEAAPQPSPEGVSSEAPTNAQLRAAAPTHIGDVFVPAATTLEEQPASAPEATAPDLEGDPATTDAAPATSESEMDDTPQAEPEAPVTEDTTVQPEEAAPSEAPASLDTSLTEGAEGENNTQETESEATNVVGLPAVEVAPAIEAEDATASTDESSYKEVFEKLKAAGADVDSMPTSAFMETVEEYGAASSDVQTALTELTEAQARVQAAEARRQAILERYTGDSAAA